MFNAQLPHVLTPIPHTDLSRPQAARRVVIAYKNFPVMHNVSHIGLGVSALNTAKVLRHNGIHADVWAILSAQQLAEKIKAANPQPSHVVIAAPWVPTLDLQSYLVFPMPDIQFAVTCHSNVGFLQADPRGIELFRQALGLEQGSLNFSAAANSKRFSAWIRAAYSRPCMYLPNLYFLGDVSPVTHRPWSGGLLKIGAFGAIRPLKNLMSAGGAALEIAADLHTQVEFHVNDGRIEGGKTVLNALTAMMSGLPNVALVADGWDSWPKFRTSIRSMNILLQPSYTESFNLVTADGASESIPSVVSDAIDWAPPQWMANVDDVLDISRVAKSLLSNPHAGAEGFESLVKHNTQGLVAWKSWLGL